MKNQIKTTATVIRIKRSGPGCTGDRANNPDLTCDHSGRLIPVYEYYDASRKRNEQDDRFFGEYKENNLLRSFLGAEEGDVVPAYYTVDKPEEVLFMHCLVSWLTSVLLPMSVGVISGTTGVVWLVITRRSSKRAST